MISGYLSGVSMLSETVFSLCKTERQFVLWITIGLAMIGVASFFEQGAWHDAIRMPLSLLTFMVLVVVVGDLLIGIFKRTIPGRAWYVLVALAGLLMGFLSFFGDPLPLVLLAFLISGTFFVVSFVKSALSK